MRRGTVVVAGSLAQRMHRGGHAWVFLQYLLGFQRLGWEVLFLDRLEPEMCVDRNGRASSVGDSANLEYLIQVMEGFGLEGRFGVLSENGSMGFGLTRREVMQRVRESALLLNVMGFLDDEEILGAAPLRVFLDIDPGFGQMWYDLGLADLFDGHDAHVTIGENVGSSSCLIPDCGIDWITLSQPVVRALWESNGAGRSRSPGPFTSVISWRGPFGPIEHGGRTFGLRVHEFRRFLPLPVQTGERFHLALDIDPADEADRVRLEANGWTLLDPRVVASNPWSYRDFIQRSDAEFMVAKALYVETRSGWISDRSLCYLAAGKPVLAQDTGIGDRYPTGSGLLVFDDLDDARAGIEELRSNYPRHARAARDLAADCFDSDLVLGRLLARLGVA